MKIWSILLVAFFHPVVLGEQASCDGCGAYNCIEDRKKCGADGYPLAYGLKYCKRFFETGRLFSSYIRHPGYTVVRILLILCLKQTLFPSNSDVLI